MILKILGSSSSGNCYILISETGQSLIIDCGVNATFIKKSLNWNVSGCAGLLISHEHGDHVGPKGKFVEGILKTSIPVYASAGTIAALHDYGIKGFWEPKPVEQMKVYQMGEYRVMPFGVQHDAAEPFAYLIEHPEAGRILFATDTAFMVDQVDERTGQPVKIFAPPKIAGVNNIMIECNYDENRLEANREREIITAGQYRRVKANHLSLTHCAAFLERNVTSDVVNVVLMHLSPRNSDDATIEGYIRNVIPGVNVEIAKPGKEIQFNNKPF